jgi:hypothetical protein
VANSIRHLPALLIGFVAGAAAMCGVVAVSTRLPPPVPVLPPATAIRVSLYPWEGVGEVDGEPVDIPPDKLDFVFRRLTPQTHFESPVHEFITPVVARAVITHADGKETSVLVRNHGHNPAVVTVDGWHYFYARNDPDVYAGAFELIQLVHEVAHEKQAHEQPNPER